MVALAREIDRDGGRSNEFQHDRASGRGRLTTGADPAAAAAAACVSIKFNRNYTRGKE